MDPLRTEADLLIGGLPLHPLLVHAVVILTPLTVLALLLGTFWPSARRRLGIVTTLGALVVLILVPITVRAGGALEEIVGPLPAVQRHGELGEMLLPWAIALFVVSAGQWAWYRWGRDRLIKRSPGVARGVTIGVGVLAVIIGIGTMILLVLIGDSGSRAVWGPVVGS